MEVGLSKESGVGVELFEAEGQRIGTRNESVLPRAFVTKGSGGTGK